MTHNFKVAAYVHGVYQHGENEVVYRFESPHPDWPTARPDVPGFISYANVAVSHMMQALETPNHAIDITINSRGTFGEAEWHAVNHGLVSARTYVTMRGQFRDMVFEVIDSKTPDKWCNGNRRMSCEAGRIYTEQIMTGGAVVDFRLDLPFGINRDDFNQLISTATWHSLNLENRLEANGGTLFTCVVAKSATYALKSEVKGRYRDFLNNVCQAHLGQSL